PCFFGSKEVISANSIAHPIQGASPNFQVYSTDVPQGEGAISPCFFGSKEVISANSIAHPIQGASPNFQVYSIGSLSLWERVRVRGMALS
ncbi:hypothetical protein ABQ370_16905, partial [Serratia fonticola]|uniref:hypothetical protein n=2 Tax=Serratia fonticola TaxID=47917 RepID=UPI003AAE670C